MHPTMLSPPSISPRSASAPPSPFLLSLYILQKRSDLPKTTVKQNKTRYNEKTQKALI